MKFNINDKVLVRLTDLGRKCHREKYEEAMRGVKMLDMYPYVPKREDDYGRTEWQLWDLMAVFGNMLRNGGPLYFETEIEIPERKEGC